LQLPALLTSLTYDITAASKIPELRIVDNDLDTKSTKSVKFS